MNVFRPLVLNRIIESFGLKLSGTGADQEKFACDPRLWRIIDVALTRIHISGDMRGRIVVHSHRTTLKFVRNYLALANRLEEAIAALIMVLGFTLVAGFTAASEKEGVRTLLLGALGCNTAWGIIDGVLSAWGNLTDRRLQLRFLTNLRSALNEVEALSAIGGRLNPLLEAGVDAEERTLLCKVLLPVISRVRLPDPNLTKDDLNGMIAIFMIDVAAVIPAAIPFLFFTDPHMALRVSNGGLIVLLFVTGLLWGRRTGSNGYLAGCCAMLLGLALVGVAIALGG